MEEKDYIIKYIVDTGDAIQKMKQLEAQATKTAANLQKTIVGPSGQPLPSSAYTRSQAEQAAYIRNQKMFPYMPSTYKPYEVSGGMSSPQISVASGYIAGMSTFQRNIPYSRQLALPNYSKTPLQLTGPSPFNIPPNAGNYQEMARSSIASAYNLGTILTKNMGSNSKTNEALDDTKIKFENLSKSIDGAGINYSKLAIRALAVIPIWMALRSAYTGLIQGIQNGAKFIVEFESAMAQIRIVGKGTEEEYKRLGDTVLAFSSTYGIAATEALKASQIFAQQGLKINEVINMTRTSMIASVILGKDIASVAEDLTSAVKAYNIPMENSLIIVDKWMKVQKNFAVTSTDLAEATKRAGATAASFGVSYDKFLGDITAIIEVTRKSGSEAGNALQMMYTRLFTTGAKAVQEIAKIPIYQDAAGKATFQNTNIFRNAESVIDDLASSWDKLTESEKIELATQIGSRRQATPFIALMNNYSRSIEAQVDSITSAGDALTSFNILQDTTKVKLVQMQNSWGVFAKTVGDTSTFKFAIDSVKNLAEGLIFLANATDYAALKMRQKKQVDIDNISLNISRLDSLKKLNELEAKIGNNPTEKNKILLGKIQASREAILAANPELASMDVKSEKYKQIRDEVERDRATEIQQLRTSEMLEVNGISSKVPVIGIFQDWSNDKTRKALIKKYGSISAAGKEILGSIEKEIQARLAAQGVGGLLGEAEESKIENKEDADLRKYKEISEEVQHRAEIMKSLGASEQQILQWQIQQYEVNGALERSVDAQNEKRKLTYKLEQSITDEIKKQSDVLQSSVEGSLKDLLLGKTNFNDMFTKIGDTMREQTAGALAGGLTDRLFDTTGIGNVFGTQMNNIRNIISGKGAVVAPIENAHYDGIKRAVPLIISAHQQGFSSNGIGGAANASWTGSNNIGGVNTSGLFGGDWWSQPVGSSSNLANRTASGGYGGLYRPQTRAIGGLTRAQALMGGTQSALTGYSAYQSAQAGGVGVGGSIASGLLAAGGSFAGIMSGIAAATAPAAGASSGVAGALGLSMGPVGWAMLGVGLVIASMIPSLLGNKSKQTSIETKTSENIVSSKIDVTNKSLEIINRNLIALRTDIRTFILPQSSYFSEKRGLEDEYSIMSRAGFLG